MDWSNTQRAEIQYFCTSTRSRTPRLLCGCTLKLQLGFILTIFASYQITEFQLTDIKAFYKLLHTPHFGPEQLRPPPPSRIAKALEQLDRDCHYQIHIRCLGEARYQITEVSPRYISDYQNELNYGYERGYVQYFIPNPIL